ncbi:MerR family transcriptional regulator [Streptomyces sp. H27-S2]|uniref:MerR family transcriptional regulator n=1 Tax=Streptomyces antarcticus TaxID=2996458 RepID=UPI00226D7B9F|nr:MerR family transcriptional regulator [Streptomyces sp. H27-S2]MCY0952115.1 MerR family transcriptional regulator [Streptomyces sp. H27-S2]
MKSSRASRSSSSCGRSSTIARELCDLPVRPALGRPRYYQERGLLPPPRREGRIARYADEHLTRLRPINYALGRGYTANGIAALLDAWERGGGLSRLLGLEREMTRDWARQNRSR